MVITVMPLYEEATKLPYPTLVFHVLRTSYINNITITVLLVFSVKKFYSIWLLNTKKNVTFR